METSEVWISPADCLRKFSCIENGNVVKANIMLAGLLRSAPSGVVVTADGVSHEVDNAFLRQISSILPFRHRYFDINRGSTVFNSTVVDDFIHLDLSTPFSAVNSVFRISIFYILAVFVAIFLLFLFVQGIFHGISYPFVALAVGITYLEPSVIMSGVFSAPMMAAAFVVYLRNRRIRAALIAPLINGRVLLAREFVEAYLRDRYSVPVERSCRASSLGQGEAEPEAANGRPRHPAFAWYAERKFERGGATLKELQAAMPKDAKGKPPSETTIREWERENFQQKPPAETLSEVSEVSVGY